MKKDLKPMPDIFIHAQDEDEETMILKIFEAGNWTTEDGQPATTIDRSSFMPGKMCFSAGFFGKKGSPTFTTGIKGFLQGRRAISFQKFVDYQEITVDELEKL